MGEADREEIAFLSSPEEILVDLGERYTLRLILLRESVELGLVLLLGDSKLVQRLEELLPLELRVEERLLEGNESVESVLVFTLEHGLLIASCRVRGDRCGEGRLEGEKLGLVSAGEGGVLSTEGLESLDNVSVLAACRFELCR